MNLKEAFRYQTYLDSLLLSAGQSIKQESHCLITTKNHKCNKANSEASDFSEVVEVDEFTPNDDVIRFLNFLIDEKWKLTSAINMAKSSIDFDIDAYTEQNKYRQSVYRYIKDMLSKKAGKRIDTAYGFKFNAEQNQVSYRYDVEVITEEAFDRKAAKRCMKNIIADSDKISSKIDEAKINTVVVYEPIFDVNDSFEDAIEIFLENVDSR